MNWILQKFTSIGEESLTSRIHADRVSNCLGFLSRQCGLQLSLLAFPRDDQQLLVLLVLGIWPDWATSPGPRLRPGPWSRSFSLSAVILSAPPETLHFPPLVTLHRTPQIAPARRLHTQPDFVHKHLHSSEHPHCLEASRSLGICLLTSPPFPSFPPLIGTFFCCCWIVCVFSSRFIGLWFLSLLACFLFFFSRCFFFFVSPL